MRYVIAAMAASMIISPALVAARPLSNETEIRSAVAGNTIAGEEDGVPFVEYFAPDGRILGENREGRYKGNWQVSKNRMCVAYDEDDGKSSAWDCSHIGLDGSRLSWTQDGETSYSTIAAGNSHGL
jgi:hypothetical protein